jgi:uncharacterized protein
MMSRSAAPTDVGGARARSRRRTAGVVAAAAAVAWLGLSVGAGIAGPWLVKSGVGPLSVAALAVFLAGLVALVLALRWVLRGARGWRRAAGVLGIVLVTLVGTYCLGIALAATVVAPSDAPTGVPAELAGATEVTVPAADRVPLAGWYLPGRTGAAVILRHGSGSERSAVVPHAAVLARHGFGVLLLDARGHGRSGGRAMDLGWNGEADIAGAVTFLAAQPGVDPGAIGVLGLSMGGEEAIGAAGSDPRIRAVVAEGVTGRTATDRAWLSEVYGAAGTLQEQLDRVTYGLADLMTAAPRPVPLRASASAAVAPILVIAAGNVDDEVTVADSLVAAAPATVSVWVVPDAGHIGGLAAAPDQWEQHVVDLFTRALLSPQGTP